MHNFFVLLFITLFMSLINQAMDNKKFIIQEQSLGKSVNISDVRAIAFLSNSEVVAYQWPGDAFVIDFSHNKISNDLKSYIHDEKWSLCSDQSKTRVMFSCRTTGEIVIYDSLLKKITSDILVNQVYRSKQWLFSFDEEEPHSIIVEQFSINSYDYINKKYKFSRFMTDILSNHQLASHQYIYNPISKTTAIISGYEGGFRIDYGSASHLGKSIKVESPRAHKNYICSLDIAFIAHYSDIAQSSIELVSPEDEDDLRDLTFQSACCITNIRTNNNIYLHHDKETRVAPCSMAFHPNNKVLVTMSAADRAIEYWQADTGQLLGKHELPIGYKNDSWYEIGTFNKYLSFSADGEWLAAVLEDIMRFPVLFEAQCGLGKNKNELILIWWCLKNYQLNKMTLPKDIINTIFNRLKVSC